MTACAMGLPVTVYQRLKRFGCPPQFLQLIVLVSTCNTEVPASLVLLELFCGVAAVTRAFAEAGLPAMGCDYLKDPDTNDMLSSAGFLHAIAMTLKLDPQAGFLWLATVCSSWVWICRSSSKRSREFPLGVPCRSNREANCMVARCCLLMVLCIAKGCAWCLEQPSSSLMVCHPAMRWVSSLAGKHVNADWWEASTCMGAFDGDTVKPTTLYGNRYFVLALGRSRRGIKGDSHLVTTLKVDAATGQKSVSGGPKLKQTQAYPDGFGKAVLDAYVDVGCITSIPDCEPELDGEYEYPVGVWELADLGSVLRDAS